MFGYATSIWYEKKTGGGHRQIDIFGYIYKLQWCQVIKNYNKQYTYSVFNIVDFVVICHDHINLKYDH